MIALSIGLILIAGFLTALRQSRALFATNESLAWLQDAGRNALSVIVPDIEHAGFYGFAGTGVRVATLPAGARDCGADFAVALENPVQASNDRWPDSGADCAPGASAGGARAGADTLTLRHASLAPSAPRAGRLQIYSRRLDSQSPMDLFGDGRAPGSVDENHAVRDLEVRTYYIANDSVGRPGWPALRVKALTESGGAAQFRDEEVTPGVEDLQVELGVAGSDGRAVYVAPDDPMVRTARIVAVRLWLRVRADSTESGFTDARPLGYASHVFQPTALESRQRRMLMERTVALRNEP
ncbi:MAG: PilW family protein [Steroidobacteraceae bacterium]|nr:PilW family protein [Steroidobacteraceae bacterium]